MISKTKWQKYLQKMAAIDEKAAELMRQFIEANGLENKALVVSYAYDLTSKYGEVASELACEMYDLMAETQRVAVPPAEPADTATIDEVTRGVMYGKYHSPNQIPSIVGRQVRQAGADTMLKNAIRDQAEWAWIPSGDTCAFCITLASRGWQKASMKVLKGDHAEHIHANCDCTFGIAFNEKGRQEYDSIYDPQKYADMYYGADGNTPKERINSIRRALYQQDPEYFRAQKNAAYLARKLENEKVLTQRLSFNYNGNPEFIPLHTIIEKPRAIAGKDTTNEIRDVPRLVATYKVDESEWKKMTGKVKSEKYIFDIHWYECDDGIVREPKIKYMKERRKQRK